MSLEIFIALIGFSVVASITPGPNNFMLLASGVNFGFLRSVPHMLGISFGFASLLLGVGFGLGQILESAPLLYLALKIAGGSYLLLLAYKIATSGSLEVNSEASHPMNFVAAAAFQWVNPKAWVMAVSAMAAYTDASHSSWSVLLVAGVFSLFGMPCIGFWTAFGTGMRRFLSNAQYLKIFNISMAILLVVSLWPMLR